MADRPNARVLQATSGGGVARAAILLGIISCTESAGPGAAVPRYYAKTQDCVDEFGEAPGADLLAHNIELNDAPSLFTKVATATAGAVASSDTSHVTGTSSWSFSGTPNDDEHIRVKVVTAGTVGTAGAAIAVSRDGGRTYGGNIRLGTATSYAVPRTGITVTFTTGTLVAGDYADCHCTGPMWNAEGLAAVFDALAAQPKMMRIVAVCGDITTADELQTVIDEISAYETEHQRHCHVLCNVRDQYPDCAMQKTRGFLGRAGSIPADVDFDATGDTITRDTGSWILDGFAVGQSVVVAGSASNDGTKGVISALTATVMTLPASPGLVAEASVDGADLTITGVSPGDLDFTATTITRNVGSFVTDGFKVGMYVTVDGTASNDGTFGPLTAVSATVLTVAAGLAAETNVSAAAVTITGTEREATWLAAVEAIVGATPQTQKISHRTLIAGGRARRKSPIDKSRRQRPAMWPIALRAMGHDLHVSTGKVALGGLEGWDLYEADGITLESYDDRVSRGALLALRVACLTTHDDLAGTYNALPVTLDNDNAPLSRLPVGLVGDLVCTVAKREATLILNGDVLTNDDGTIQTAEGNRIEARILSQLMGTVLSPGPEGPRASNVTVTMDRTVNLLEVGTLVPFEVLFTPRGYIEQISVTVRVAVGG